MRHPTTDGWCILRTKPSTTLSLAASLSRAGFDVWTPSEAIRPRGRRGKERVPIVATFVFAKVRHLWTLVDLAGDPLSRHDGFSVMRHHGTLGYPVIADRELEPLRSEESRVIPKQQRKVPQPGEPVRLPEGPFAGMSGIVESADHKHAWVRFGGYTHPAKIATFLLRPDRANRLLCETGRKAA